MNGAPTGHWSLTELCVDESSLGQTRKLDACPPTAIPTTGVPSLTELRGVETGKFFEFATTQETPIRSSVTQYCSSNTPFNVIKLLAPRHSLMRFIRPWCRGPFFTWNFFGSSRFSSSVLYHQAGESVDGLEFTLLDPKSIASASLHELFKPSSTISTCSSTTVESLVRTTPRAWNARLPSTISVTSTVGPRHKLEYGLHHAAKLDFARWETPGNTMSRAPDYGIDIYREASLSINNGIGQLC
ncbi:hypothetical protein GQ600_6304 [Phytophthora cactorum]|nr:hypothetical protein GQ600_6304 [Phytophthora cactorum]